MKIVIATGIYPPDIGGPAIHSEHIARALAKNGYQVTVIAYGTKSLDEQSPFKVRRISRSLPKPVRWLSYFLVLFFSSFGAKTIYAFDLTAAGLPAMLVARLLGKKFLIRIGGDPIWERVVERGERFLSIHEYYRESLHQFDRPKLFRTIQRVLNRADRIVIYNQFAKDIYVRYFAVNPKQITIIENPCFRRSVASETLPQPATLLFAGRFVAYKNLKMVIDVFEGVAKKHEGLRLVLIGDGPDKTALEDQARKSSVASRIEFRPPIKQSELFPEIKKSAICLGPALTEFNPNFILECLSFGKPVLLSRENGLTVRLPESFIFDASSKAEFQRKMENLLSTEAYRVATRAVAEMPIEQTWEKVTAAHLRIIEKL